ncbi:uncharacterized protein BBOV_IV001970 [Babesia bovis T2Bo]|uniref:Uncharacterized protein n=1 Tax=Babesia bovis TaxID=5865 RepID=A7AVG8_BABBO|nr:uncharacterized protein BBOV_IV001970 [Babesia bovis T2Bo]EDO05794.1 hypothetical protein BBOV_IV001970 [Babesia bovis T2Bo]|eukprot:XP_001609362.1 hypothetical protein [Babesia bovis T2Bo]
MSDVIGASSANSFMASDMQNHGATFRLIDDNICDVNAVVKRKTVVRISDAVHRCGTTASECVSNDVSDARNNEDTESTDCASAEVSSGDEAVPAQSQSTSDLVIFDYDDTILPTFALACSQRSGLGHLLDPEMISKELDRLTESVLANLNKVLSISRLVIVTNASYEWLMQSCERYIPRVAEFFAVNNIRIISARDRLENSLLSQRHWKYFIFIDLIEEYFNDELKNGLPFTVTSIGDGSEEREACMKLAAIFKNQSWIFKNLKFLSQPTVGCLIQQHILLAKSFDSFFSLKTSADLCILFDKSKS